MRYMLLVRERNGEVEVGTGGGVGVEAGADKRVVWAGTTVL